MLNKKLIGIALFGLSSIVLASSGMRAYMPQTPSQTGQFFVGIEGLYFQPNNNKLDYGIYIPNYDNSKLPVGKIVKIEPEYQLGFSIKGGYHFLDTDAYLTIGYSQIHSSDSDLKEAKASDAIADRISHPLLEYASSYAKAKVDFDYDTVDILIGKKTNFGNLGLYISTGISYVRLDTKYSANYVAVSQQPLLLENHTTYTKTTSDYNGIGPRFLSKGIYHLGNNFGLFASLGATLLVGDEKVYQYTDYYTDATYKLLDVKETSIHHIVPELDTKLGLNYTHNSNNSYSFSIDAGWQVINYFNARDSIRFIEDYEALERYIRIASDVSFNGPYAGIKVFI